MSRTSSVILGLVRQRIVLIESITFVGINLGIGIGQKFWRIKVKFFAVFEYFTVRISVHFILFVAISVWRCKSFSLVFSSLFKLAHQN